MNIQHLFPRSADLVELNHQFLKLCFEILSCVVKFNTNHAEIRNYKSL